MSNLYDLMSNVTPRTGGEFKLIYANREKVAKASGLAVWLFDDNTVKDENISFSETIPNKKNIHESYVDPLAGNDFKLIYGNKDKIDLAKAKTGFLFGNINDRPTIDGLVFETKEDGTCHFLIGSGGCQTDGIYEITSDLDEEDFVYAWKIVSGNAEIMTDPTQNFVKVKTDIAEADQIFDIECMVIDNMVAQKLVEENLTHTKIGHLQIVVDDISEDSNTACMSEHPVEYSCEARSVHTATTTSSFGVELEWSVSDDAYIIDGQGTSTVTVGTSGRDLVESFNVEVRAWDDLSEDTLSVGCDHVRTIRDAINIASLTEESNTGCSFEAGMTCVATSTHKVVVNENGLSSTYLWSTDDVEAVIISGQGTDEIVISTTGSDLTKTFNVTVLVGDGYTQDSQIVSVTHTRAEQVSGEYDQELLYDNTNIATEFIV